MFFTHIADMIGHKSHEHEFLKGYACYTETDKTSYKTFVSLVSALLHEDHHREDKQTEILSTRSIRYTSVVDDSVYNIRLIDEKWILVTFMYAGTEICHMLSDKDVEILRVILTHEDKHNGSSMIDCFLSSMLIEVRKENHERTLEDFYNSVSCIKYMNALCH